MLTKLDFILLQIGLAATACSTMSDHSAEFRAGLEDARAENARHEAACTAASTITAMNSEMGVHTVVTGGALVRMTQGMNMMTQYECCGLSELEEAMDDFRLAESDHRAWMVHVKDADRARSMCTSHTAVMRQQLDETLSSIRVCKGD